MKESSSVQVAVRVRPMLGSEAGSTKCIETLQSSLDQAANVVRIGGPSGPTFVFDQAFDGRTPQEFVFQSKVLPLIERCLEGYNATVLAYGQTGSGKTHTIMGPSTALEDGESAGLIPRAVRTLFARLSQQKKGANKADDRRQQSENDQPAYDYEVRVQFLELYGEVIRDLLTAKPSSEKLTIRDIGNEEPEVLGATQLVVESAEEALLCLTRGMMRRVTAETAMNATSSRSHAILSVMVHQTSSVEGHTEIKRSKFSFVDLAGSERLKRTHAQGQRMKEGVDINKGLLVLGNVISALGDETKRGKTFVPYRDSKLTRLLKGSLGGNHKTLMIACVSPSSLNLEESLNCLRYANRAKNIQNNAVVNVDTGSKLLSELRSQVQHLASNLLRIKKGGDPAEIDTFSLEMLQKLSEGESCVSGTSNSNTPTPLEALDFSFGGNQRVRELEIELERTKSVLLQASEELVSTRDELFETRAHREKFKTHLTKYLTPEEQKMFDSPDCETPLATSGSEAHDFDQRLRINDVLLETKKELQATTEELFTAKAEKEMYRLRLNAGDPTDVETAFLEKAASYEAEISSLKAALGNQRSASSVVENAKCSNEQRSQLLSQLQSELLASISPDATAKIAPGSPEFLRMHSRVLLSISPGEQLDAEEEAEQAELSAITIKFLDEDEEQGGDFQRNEGESVNEEAAKRHRQLLEASLLELTHSIDEKENLIEQLQLSEEKYADMRAFYEEKLRQMEEQVREREKEREALVHELEERQASKSDTKDLQVRLKDKESHIFSLKKRQQELVGLTQVSSRNEAEINRLRHDVTSMKQKKVEMQNLMAQERKSHLGEIQILKKKSMQLDREVNKWKKISEQKTFEAARAHKVSKTHLEQVSQLRAKYKEAERNLRVRTVKRGVMEKAGLDPVLVGSRRNNKQGDAGGSKSKLGARASPKLAEIDTDLIWEFLDRKVADVGRKEALADKLANEWEDHMELVSQKHLLLDEVNSGREVPEEELEAVDVQLKYKEARIRQLAQRLGNQTKMKEGREPEIDFLGEEDYKALFRNVSPLAASQQTARVLFGMVVRERRRVAALARAASNLDEKALVAQKEAKEKDDAFRSFIEEERHQRAALAQEQQEQILSLMELVKQDDASDGESSHPSDVLVARSSSASRVMVLANERNEALERQLLELQGEQETAEMYKAKATRCTESLAVKNEECVVLHQQLKALRSSLQQIHEVIATPHRVDKGIKTTDLSSDANVGDFGHAVLALVKNALHAAVDKGVKNSNEEPKSDSYQMFASRNRHVELTNASDSERDEEIPDWAGDIMADLAVIADGEIPEVLLNSPTFTDVCQQPKGKSSGSVFDRLTNPENFTGVQKQRTARSNGSQKARQERRDIARKITENLEKLEKTVGIDLKAAPEDDVVGAVEENLSGDEESKTNGCTTERSSGTLEKAEHRSVFDRLLSPSAYTGTQKDRAQRTQKMNIPEDDDADQLLDDILSGESEVGVDENERDMAVQVADKIAEYTQQNVFERLQTTTTRAYARKHGRQSAAAHRAFPSSPVRMRSDGDFNPHAANDPLDYTSQNVFKRLQKTETQASAQKKNSVSLPTSSKQELGKPIGSGRDESEALINNDDPYDFVERDYIEQNVFERLQRTTTQSFAGKHGINIDEKSEN